MLSVSTLFLWEHLKRYFLDITSHTEASCEPILSHPFSQQLMRLLYLIHGLVMRFGLWAYHFPIAGEICIKLASLLEYKATHLRPDLTVSLHLRIYVHTYKYVCTLYICRKH